MRFFSHSGYPSGRCTGYGVCLEQGAGKGDLGELSQVDW